MRSRLSLIAVLSVLGGALLLAGWMLIEARQTAWDHAAETLSNTSQLLSLDIDRAIDMHDRLLQGIQQQLDRPDIDAMRPESRDRVLRAAMETTDAISGILVMDASGKVIAGNVQHTPIGVSLASRDYFQMQARSTGNYMIMGAPVIGIVTGQAGLPLSRLLIGHDGHFAGVVSCMFGLSYFDHLFENLKLDPGGAVLVMRDNGQLLVRQPAMRGGPAADEILDVLLKPTLHNKSGVFEAVSPIDGVKRLYSYHQIEKTPLVVMVASPLSAIYAEWWQKALVSAMVGVPLLVASLLLGGALSQELERRSAAEREASERGAEFKATFDHSADGLFLLCMANDGSFVVERANAALAKMWNLPVMAMEGREPRAFLPGLMAQRLGDRWRHAVRANEAVSDIFDWDLADRATTLEIAATPICEADGQIRFLLGNVRDVTEQQEVVRQLQQAKKLEALGRITAGITHDFNNLLQVLLSGMREVMLQVPAASRPTIQNSLQAVTHGVALTRRLLNLARQTSVAPRVVDINQSITRLSELMRWTLGNSIKLNIVAGQAVAPVLVDDSKFQLCLLNLASNARDAMAEGGQLSIYTRTAPAVEATRQGLRDTDHTVIVVQDTGQGMESAVRARVFDAFYSTKGPSKGTGLGLWMVRSLVQEAGGDVRIDSEPGCGTRVSLWLPRVAGTLDAQEPETDDQIAMVMPAIATPAPAALKAPITGQRILLVDDDILVRQGLTRLLAEAGFHVTSSSDPAEAVGILRADMPLDLLIVDQNMAGMSGASLIGLAQQFHPTLPAVMITGDLEPGHVPAGAALLHKPIDPDTLLARIQASLAASPVPAL